MATSPVAAGDAVAVADEEELKSLVVAHPDLRWTTTCEQLAGCHGSLPEVAMGNLKT